MKEHPLKTNTETGPMGSSSCKACDRPLETFDVRLPWGLSSLTFFQSCPCQQEKEEAKQREREILKKKTELRQDLQELGYYRAFLDSTFESFHVTLASKPLVEVCQSYAASIEERLRDGLGLALFGRSFTGKTHLSLATLRAVVEQNVEVLFLNVPQFLEWGRVNSPENERAKFHYYLDRASRVGLLVLDDLGIVGNLTEYVEKALYLIINPRFAARLPTLITANEDWDSLQERIGERCVNRLRQRCEGYWLNWRPYR